MIEIHQVICGDDNGSYSLLKSSYTDATTPIRFASSTDLIDRPPNGELENPIIRGFWKDNHFILIKTFPDTSKGVRKGRVFSHALIIKEKDLLLIKDITQILKHHLTSIDKSIALNPINFKNNDGDDISKKEDNRMSYAINNVIEHHSSNNTIVWIGKEGYLNWISNIWPAIPKEIKKSIKIGAAFDPQKIDKNLLNLVYIPDSIKPNWTNTDFKLIDYNDSASLKTQTAHYLAGYTFKAKELSQLLSDFSIVPKDIDDISQFEKMIPTYKGIETDVTLKKLIIFADLVSKYTTKTQSSLQPKEKLFNVILNKLPTAGIAEINIITNADWSGFENAEKRIVEPLNTWLEKNIFEEKSSKTIPALINKAFEDTKSAWWSNPVKKYISVGLKRWKKNYAELFWDWIKVEPKLIEKLGSLLPKNAEKDIVSSIPRLKKEVEKKILQFAYENRWIFLHSTIVLINHSINDALKKQLSIDNTPNEFGALRIMAKKTLPEKFLLSSLNFDDERLYVLSGEICSKNPKLLSKNIVLDSSGWHKIWLEFTNQGNNVWDGFSHPNKILNEILDNLIDGKLFDDYLLEKISSSSNDDLSNYPRRKDIWLILSGQTKNNFLKKTAHTCLISIAKGTLSLAELEPTLRQEIQKDETINGFIISPTVDTTSKIKILEVFPNIDKKLVISLIDNNRFSNSEAIILGERIRNRQWKSIASHISSVISWRSDLKLAIQQCEELFNVFQRFSLSFSGVLSSTISTDDWWEIFTNQAIKLYPKGADQNGIWSNAGGHDSDLPLKITGREIWNHAVYIMRNGGDPKVLLLINKMLEEFPNDEILKKLRQTI
ncbi:hypothetical protein [Galbibacter sp.]|uniref:GAP1-N1 domain-containing protein n=1 Tax=Galbibacter sp. TaxID=2918471 RepID=UPI003A93D07C